MSVIIRPLREDDLTEARRILSLAFGTFIGLPDPMRFAHDQDYVRTRFRADPSAAFAAEQDGKLIGSAFVTRWGSVGFFGPITVDVPYWNGGIAQKLLEPVMGCFERWGTRLDGLFTFAQSPKHVGLYSKFGFWPRGLTAILGKPGGAATPAATSATRAAAPVYELFSAASSGQKIGALEAARGVADTVYSGLDLEQDIRAADEQKLGDTLLVRDANGELEAFAVCQVGAETEAGGGICYVKFAAVKQTSGVRRRFDRLLDSVEAFGVARGATQVQLGMNMARDRAFRALRERGYRVGFQGVAMHRPNDAGYSRSAIFAIDDWR